MAAEEFFKRWSKPKPAAPEVQAPAQQPPAPAAPEARAPTAADLAGLRRESDFTPFMAQGVDETLKRAALKKLFSDPHFNRMDRLDTYIDDYNKFEPLPAEMLAALNHAKSLLNPLAEPERAQPATPESEAPLPIAAAEPEQLVAQTEEPAPEPAPPDRAPAAE